MLSLVVIGIFTILFMILLTILSYQDGVKFETWESKAISLGAAIYLTLFSVHFVGPFIQGTVTAFDFYQSAPLIFEVLVPISSLLILQNIIPEVLSSLSEKYDANDFELVGFAIACFLSIAIIAIPQYIDLPLNREFESMLLYFGIIVWWIVKRGRLED